MRNLERFPDETGKLWPRSPPVPEEQCVIINKVLLSEPCATNALQCCEAGEQSFIDAAASHGGRRGQQDVKTQTNTDCGTRPCEKNTPSNANLLYYLLIARHIMMLCAAAAMPQQRFGNFGLKGEGGFSVWLSLGQ